MKDKLRDYSLFAILAATLLLAVLMYFSAISKPAAAGFSLLYFNASSLSQDSGPVVVLENHEGAAQDYSIIVRLDGAQVSAFNKTLAGSPSGGESYSFPALTSGSWGNSTIEVVAERQGKPALSVYASLCP